MTNDISVSGEPGSTTTSSTLDIGQDDLHRRAYQPLADDKSRALPRATILEAHFI